MEVSKLSVPAEQERPAAAEINGTTCLQQSQHRLLLQRQTRLGLLEHHAARHHTLCEDLAEVPAAASACSEPKTGTLSNASTGAGPVHDGKAGTCT